MPSYKVILIGDAGSGKTSLLYRYLPLDWRRLGRHNVLGFAIDTIKINMPKSNEEIKVNFWEILGDHKRYGPKFFERFYDRVNGIMLVFDVVDPKTFKNLSFWKNQIEKYIDYKDIETLERLLTHRGKIYSRKRSGNCAGCQRKVKTAIKRARYMALLPYSI